MCDAKLGCMLCRAAASPPRWNVGEAARARARSCGLLGSSGHLSAFGGSEATHFLGPAPPDAMGERPGFVASVNEAAAQLSGATPYALAILALLLAACWRDRRSAEGGVASLLLWGYVTAALSGAAHLAWADDVRRWAGLSRSNSDAFSAFTTLTSLIFSIVLGQTFSYYFERQGTIQDSVFREISALTRLLAAVRIAPRAPAREGRRRARPPQEARTALAPPPMPSDAPPLACPLTAGRAALPFGRGAQARAAPAALPRRAAAHRGHLRVGRQ